MAIAALALAGCSSDFDAPVPVRQADPFETVQQFYRPLAANAVRTFLNAPNIPIEVAELRISVAPQPGDWATCARTVRDGRMKYFAVFFWERAVLDTRPSILIDRCEQEQYSVFRTNTVRSSTR
jgi:hypothetical protein